ncbi:MAG: aminotransferase class V-fold PLP-dependent enzyme, partial [Fimbriimonadaceae bacterium]|nr:aminotransferase class V-fold PLP-dependent enzyme [Fimbriimonadaceae bacterium]
MVRADFPYFAHHPQDVYLDSAATTHKPSVVIEAVRACYENYAPIHRGLYRSSVELSDQYEQVRSVAAAFIGAVPEEIIFTKNATEGLNLLAHSLPLAGSWKEGDEVILSVADHHAVILPWQEAAKRHGLALRFLELDEQGAIDLESLPTILSDRTRAIAITHVSNTLGSIADLPRLRQILTSRGSEAVVIADACQSAPHFPISVGSLGADFLVFSGHKLYAPAGTGVLWGRESMLGSLPPLLTGGDMVVQVGRLESAYLPPPQRFEAGT